MLRSKRSEYTTAAVLMAPFVVIYGLLFVYPTIKMAQLSLTDAPLIGAGKWVGLDNYYRLASDRLFSVAVWNTVYFVILSVVPSTLVAMLVALGVNRLKGWTQSVVLAAFFLPYILPVSVVFRIWSWMFDKDFGIAQNAVQLFNNGQHLSIFRTIPLFMPAVAFVTVWWLLGFNVLLFIAGLRNISTEIYEAAEPRRREPLGSVHPHHLAADLAGDGAGVHDQAHSPAQDLRSGLSVRQRRQGRRDHGHGPVHIHGGLSAEQGRSRRRGGGGAFRAHRRFVGAAVSAAQRARRPMTASVETGADLVAPLASAGSPACAIWILSASSSPSSPSSPPCCGRFRSIGGW